MVSRLRTVVLLLAGLITSHSCFGAGLPIPPWRDGATDLASQWRVQTGDNAAWARPEFNDRSWPETTLGQDAAGGQPGWLWYRLDLKLPPNHPAEALMVTGPENAYEVYANGQRLEGARILWPQRIRLNKENVLLLPEMGDHVTLAFRLSRPDVLTQIYGIGIDQVLIGTVPAIRAEQKIGEYRRVTGAVASAGINLSLVLAGLGALLIYLGQRNLREYLWLGLCLITSGVGGVGFESFAGMFPIWVNSFLGDPCSILAPAFQIEFTFAFARRRPGWPWRWYVVVLLFFPLLSLGTSFGLIPGRPYLVAEGLSQLPLAVLLPIFLTIWFRAGNREAGWLIVPSLLAGISTPINDYLLLSGLLGWRTAMPTPIRIGIVPVELTDFFSLLFLLAIGVVMFLRFARVNGDRARAAAELDAARLVQQQLIPMQTPDVAGCRVQAAYFPAAEVGGDFYQVLPVEDGAALVAVGDVSGKGLQAAMAGVLAIGALRALMTHYRQPAQLMSRLNEEIVRAGHGGFITCLIARIETDGRLTLANAGHLLPYRNGDEVELAPGLPLGIVAGLEYSETTLQLACGDALTFLSDGVVEAQDAEGRLLGFERARAMSGHSPMEIARAACEFGQSDDITVLSIAYSTVEALHA